MPNGQDRRLAGIAHTGPGGVAVSAFGYGYDVGGSITRWTQSQPFHTVEPMSAWTIEQDAADQLTGVSVEGRAAGRQVFSYDLAGNRLTAQSGNATSTTAYNALNQLTRISGGGRLRFSGTTSEAANVSVQGRAARMLDATTFTADAEVVPGVNTIPVVATDGNGNRRTNNYQVTVPGGATRAFVYDGNGNLLDDGERTYQWDAKNRLIEAKRGADTWQWSYNAFDQRVSETKNGVGTKRWVWAGGNQPAEERDSAGNVTRRFYPQGEQAGATKFYYTKDHLGSIREVLGANGTVVSSSRYDAWGVRTTVGAQDAASFGFTGHLEHKELGLVFTLYRAYDPATGRWLSRDPIGEEGGINLYGYVGNNPVMYLDPLGLYDVGFFGAGGNTVGNAALRDYVEGRGGKVYDRTQKGQQQAMDDIKKARDGGDKCLTISGYSWGTRAARDLVNKLKEQGIDVEQLNLVDPVNQLGQPGSISVPSNVKSADNFYQTSGGPFKGGPAANPGPNVRNHDRSGPNVDHNNIVEKSLK